MKRILIVEDEPIMREALRDWVKDIGYQVDTATDGEEALTALAEQDFAVALLDLKLPGKDGLEVLREAKGKNGQLKGIIITGYPSFETAVKAGQLGAVDYLCKPLELNQLEKVIRDLLGPVQAEVRPAAVTSEAVAEPAVLEEAKPEELIAIAPDEIPTHLRQGKAHFQAGRYGEALREFETVVAVAPGSIEARVWARKAREALGMPKAEAVAEEAKPKFCVWMSLGMVSYRICVNDYNCMSCEFDQEIQEKMAAGGGAELEQALVRLKELPGSQRLCRYALKGDVSYRVCSRLFRCATCEFGQMMDDTLQQMLAQRVAELATRQEALRKKRGSWWWTYWESQVPTGLAKSYSSN